MTDQVSRIGAVSGGMCMPAGSAQMLTGAAPPPVGATRVTEDGTTRDTEGAVTRIVE